MTVVFLVLALIFVGILLWQLLPRCPNDNSVLDLATNYHLTCPKCNYIKHME